MTHHRTIEDFGLVRHTTASFMDLRFGFIHPYIGDTTATDWKFCNITNPTNPALQFAYAVYTQMRVWELLTDCWTDAAQANTDSLRWIGISDIVNADIRSLIRKENDIQKSVGRVPGTGRMTIRSDSVTWDENFFIRTVERVAGAFDKRVVSATLSDADIRGVTRPVSNDSEIDNAFVEMNMVLELR
ncbi:hypothetical protein N0V93_006141 [Gnomoniopsis smithogilvyi]|uniref:Uncharacterized protein n=1 Tax=Gnomoniopsis smithogilvyi TaxID=1191159 RepID=A0A9W8YP46_9PEZI|nr:hypothetical protein N0V93_006141 [Gnomoniopsis smithogilvyi]